MGKMRVIVFILLAIWLCMDLDFNDLFWFRIYVEKLVVAVIFSIGAVVEMEDRIY